MLHLVLGEVGLAPDFPERNCYVSRVVSAEGTIITVWTNLLDSVTLKLLTTLPTTQPTNRPQGAHSFMITYISLGLSVSPRSLIQS